MPGVTETVARAPRVLMLVTEDWYFRSHRFELACRLRRAGWDVCVGMRVNGPTDDLDEVGIEIVSLPFERSLRHPLRDLHTLAAIRRCIAAWRPDILHLVALKPILLGGMAVGADAQCSTINAFTGLGYLFSSNDRLARLVRGPLLQILRRLSARRRAWNLVQNEDDQAELVRQRIGTVARTCLIRGAGVDVSIYTAAPFPARPFRVLLPARLLVDKGVREFVAAARRLRSRRQDIECVLAGDLDRDNHGAIERDELDGWLREGSVRWIGYCRDMVAVYQAAHAVCLPSYREGLPKALLEGAACARPLIATDVPGCRDVCRDGVSGLLVPPRDSVELAAAIERLADDATLAARLGAGARRLVETEFALEAVADETLGLYARVNALAGT
ncbi:MAG: glycosyltransferase family 4 protein [Gammaproteobacteria bacterium]